MGRQGSGGGGSTNNKQSEEEERPDPDAIMFTDVTAAVYQEWPVVSFFII